MVRDIMAAASGVDEKLEVESVFSTYLYTGNGSTLTINNGINLADEGGMVWIKGRSSTFAYHNSLFDTDRGVNVLLNSDTANADVTDNGTLTSFNSNGFSLDSRASVNYGNDKFVSWTFRKEPKFFDIVTYTGNGVAGRQIPHNLGCEVGMIIVKRTNAASDWTVYNRGVASDAETDALFLNLTNAKGDHPSYWNDTAPTTTEFTVGNGSEVNSVSGTYVAYLFAHDPSTDGIIQCGSYVGTGADNNSITLGWEPQYIMIKASSGTGGWIMCDVMRGIATPTVYDSPATATHLLANTSDAEITTFTFGVTATGFNLRESNTQLNGSGTTYIYMAIRRPNKVPTSGSEVFAIDTRNNYAAGYAYFSGFPVDLAINHGTLGTTWHSAYTRMTSSVLDLNLTNSEGTQTSEHFAFNNGFFMYPSYDASQITHMFKRAKGFFDVVATSMTSSTINHSLGCTPELFITRTRTSASHWNVYAPSLYSGYMNLNETISVSTVCKASATATTVTYLATYTSEPSIHYLFATLAGVSKVGSYNGNGTSQTIPCGFSTGARFILIKRTDSTGDWYIWDTTRGIVAANDPHLSLNTTAAQVTTDDSVDPAVEGFIVNQNTATNINVNGGSYIFLAIA